MSAPQPLEGEDLYRWVSAAIEHAPQIHDEEPLSLRHRPLANWGRLVHGEADTLSGGRASQELLARVRAASSQPKPPKVATIAFSIVFVLLCVAFVCFRHLQ